MEGLSPPASRLKPADGLFWLGWVAASTAAILLGMGIIFGTIFLAKAVSPGINEDRLMGLLIFPILASLLGVLQWLILRRRIPGSGWWILATVVGLLGGMGIASGMVRAIVYFTGREWNWDSVPGLLLIYGLIGYILSLAQLPVLRQHVKSMALWPLAATLGWFALCLIMGKSIDRTTDILALGAVPSAFTGLFLILSTSKLADQSTSPA